jgi:TonB-dependent receptor
MPPVIRRLVLTLVLALVITPGTPAFPGSSVQLSAQPTQMAVVSGQVLEAGTGRVLPGTLVRLVELDRSSVTARDGRFQFIGVPAGSYTLSAAFLGYAAPDQRVSVAAGQTVEVEVVMTSEALAVEGFTVEGLRSGQARALNLQANAPNLVTIVSADAIGQFPDANIAEALQRLPGISITRKNETGEGQFVIIRGLESNFNAVTVDGVRLPTTETGVRAVPLDVFTANVAERVQVTKALTPDQDGDAIGGTIDLQTPTAFDETRRVLRGSFSFGRSDAVDSNNLGIPFTYGDVFGSNRQWGLLVATTYLKRGTGGEQVGDGDTTVGLIGGPNGIRSNNNRRGPPGFMGLEFNRFDIERERRAITTSLDYRPSDSRHFFLRGNYADLAEDRVRNEFEVYGDNRGENGQNLLARQRLFLERFEEAYSTVSAGGMLQPRPGLRLDFIAAHSRAENERPDYIELRHGLPNLLQRDGSANSSTSTIPFTDINARGPVVFDLSRPRFPTWVQQTEQDLYDDSRYTFNRYDSWQDRGDENIVTLKLDARLERDLGGFPGYFKSGVKFTGREKEQVTQANSVSVRRNAALADFFPRSAVVGGSPVRHLEGNYLWGRLYDPAATRAFIAANPSVFAAGTGEGGLEIFQEDVAAGYVMAGVDFGALDILTGVRIERTAFAATFGRGDAARTSENNYTDVLPSLHANYRVSDRLIVRGAATAAMARPNFSDLSARRTESSSSISSGNPELEPLSALNLDLSVERYLGSLGLASAGVFHKRIENFIYRGLATSTSVDPDTGLPITRPENGDVATITGLELAYQQQLRMLPSPFDGLGFLANVTFLRGESKLKPNSRAAGFRVDPDETFALYDQPDYLGNVAVSYEKYDASVRLAYVFRSGYLERIDGESAAYDKYLLPNNQLDLTASYRFSDRLRVFLETTNLTGAYTYDSTMGPERGVQKNLIQNSWIATFGLGWQL